MSQQDPQDVQHVPTTNVVTPRDTPPTPPSPEELDTATRVPADTKASRKREREVSLEPATPKADESASEDTKERRTPAPKKKNRVTLDPTKEEEDETPPESPTRASVDLDLSTSPPYETKVRQISRKVRGMKWDDKDRPAPEFSVKESADEPEVHDGNGHLEPPIDISEKEREPTPEENERAASPEQPAPAEEESRTPIEPAPDSSNDSGPPPTTTQTAESDSDDQEKGVKRKIDERQTSVSPEEQPTKATTEVTKRARDDNEEDANPRERKRPTPPPEEREEHVSEKGSPNGSPPTTATEPVAPQPKVGGFLAYAATSSPFAAAKGPSVFGQKSTPSPTPLAGTSNGAASSLSSAYGVKSSVPFAIPSGNKTGSASKSVFGSPSAFSSSNATSPNNLSTSPTGTKRSGFEAFASAPSPFASVARAKSPTPSSLARSKSPTRRPPTTSINAFKSYAGSGTQSFTAPSPPVKKQRHDSGDDADDDKAGTSNVLNATSNCTSSGESEEDPEADKPTFADRLRAEANTEGHEASDEDEKPVATEQEVHTGEEQEDTVFQVRGKLYALSDQNAWKERGTGLLKMNVRKSDGCGARLVMRKEAVFTLLLNVPLFKGMRCNLAQDPRYVRFSCIESGKTVHYNLRLSNAKVAGELLEEINANIPSDEPGDAV